MQALSDILIRQKELAEQAANGVYSTSQRAALQNESTQLTNEFNRIVSTTVYNGSNLLDGTTATIQLQVGLDGSGQAQLGIDLTALSNPITLQAGGPGSAPSGTAEVDTFDFANTASALGSFTFQTFGGVGVFLTPGSYVAFSGYDNNGVLQNYYAWFSLNGMGSDPTLPGKTGFMVDIPTDGITGQDVADTIKYYYDLYFPNGGVTMSTGPNALTVVSKNPGLVNAATDNAGFLIAQNNAGAGIAPGNYFQFTTPQGSYYVWFHNTSTNGGSSPGLAGQTGIQVDYNNTSSASAVRDAARIAIAAALSGQATVANAGVGTGITITNLANGAVTAPTSSGMLPSMTVTRNTVGTTSGVNSVTDMITVASHNYWTGLAVNLTTSGGFPGGLGAGTYYVIKVDGNRFKLATSLVNAQAGTAIDITTAGTGNLTLTPTGTLTMQTNSAYISDNDIGTQDAAKLALTTTDSRLQNVTTARGTIGASQSRLTSVASRLAVSSSNFLDAASRIKDVDVATEAANLARTKIVQQAAATILAHASRQPNIVLDLLNPSRR